MPAEARLTLRLMAGIKLAPAPEMSNRIHIPAGEVEPGPEGVPIDAPDNDGPAISPLAPSRMPRAEADPLVFDNSPEFHDHNPEANNARQKR